MRADALVYELLEGTMSVRENAPKPIRRSIVPVCRSRPPDMFVTTNVAVATETPTWPGEEPPMLVVVKALLKTVVPPNALPPFATGWPFGVEPIATGATRFTPGLAPCEVTVYPPVIGWAQALTRAMIAARIASRAAVVVSPPLTTMLALPLATVARPPVPKLMVEPEGLLQRRFVPFTLRVDSVTLPLTLLTVMAPMEDTVPIVLAVTLTALPLPAAPR